MSPMKPYFQFKRTAFLKGTCWGFQWGFQKKNGSLTAPVLMGGYQFSGVNINLWLLA